MKKKKEEMMMMVEGSIHDEKEARNTTKATRACWSRAGNPPRFSEHIFNSQQEANLSDDDEQEELEEEEKERWWR